MAAKDSYAGALAVKVPCGSCMPCRLNRAMQWSTRLAHEAMYHDTSSFLTLTYSDEHLPDSYSVDTREFQLFMKRLRMKTPPLRFFACGEYGGQTNRPHYHALIFGYDFPDKQLWRRSPTGHLLYRSPMLEQVWPYGHSEIGTVTPQSAGYVARYVTKKVTGNRAVEHYQRIHPLTGQEVQVKPEFLLMSRRPGIGQQWFEDYKSDAFPSDFVIVDGTKRPVPKYYYKRLLEEEKRVMAQKRRKQAVQKDEGWERDLVKEEVAHRLVHHRLLRQMEE